MDQYRCPNCEEYRRSFLGRHGLTLHLFRDHHLSGDQIDDLLRDPVANGYGKAVEVFPQRPSGDPHFWDIVMDGTDPKEVTTCRG